MNFKNPYLKYPNRQSIMRSEKKHHLLFWILIVLMLGAGAVRVLFMAYRGQITVISSDPAREVREQIQNQSVLGLEEISWLEGFVPNNFGLASFNPNPKISRTGRYFAIVGQKEVEEKIVNETLLIDVVDQKVVNLEGFVPISNWSGAVIVLFSEQESQLIAYDISQNINRPLAEIENALSASISPDGEKTFVNYFADDYFSTLIVWLNSGAVLDIKQGQGVISSIWSKDGNSIYGFIENNESNPLERKLARYDFDSNIWRVLDLKIDELHFKKWQWLEADRTALITAGYDDGAYLYYADLENNLTLPLGEISGNENYIFFTSNNLNYYIVNDQEVVLKNLKGEDVKRLKVPQVAGENYQLAEVLLDNQDRLILIRMDMVNFDNQTKEILVLDEKATAFDIRRVGVAWNGPVSILNDWLLFTKNDGLLFFKLPSL